MEGIAPFVDGKAKSSAHRTAYYVVSNEIAAGILTLVSAPGGTSKLRLGAWAL